MYHPTMNALGLLSRRHLIRLGAVAGAGRLLPRSPARAQEGPEAAWSPADGLRLAGPVQGLSSLDPALSRDLDTNFIVRQIARGLVGYDTQLNPVPELAAAIDVSGDLRTYDVTIRGDAVFHDGRPVEAEDVAWSFARALNPESAGGDPNALAAPVYLRDIAGADDVLAGRATGLEGIEVIGPSRLRITLQEPSATFQMKLAAVPASILDRHQAVEGAAWWQAINGSGPFSVQAIDATAFELAAVPAWRTGMPAVERVRVLLGADASQPENLYQAGEIDLVPDVLPQLVPLIEDPASGVPIGAMIEVMRFSLAYIALGNQRPPLDDVHIRRALQRVFPVERFARAMFGDRVVPATGVLPPGMLGTTWGSVLPAQDVEAARAEIAASRYGAPEAVPAIPVYAADIAPVEALRDLARDELGLVVEAVQVNWYDFLAGLAAQRWDAYSLLWGADYPDPEALLWVLFGSDSAENYTGYRNAEFDAAIAAARREGRIEQRRARYAEAQRILVDDAAVIPLYMPRGYTLARPGMRHVPVTSMGLLGLEAIR